MLRDIAKRAKSTSQPGTPTLDVIREAAKKMSRYGVSIGEEDVVVGSALWEQIIHHPQVVYGEIEITDTETLNRYIVFSPATGDRFSVLVSGDFDHRASREANASRQ